MLFNIIYRLSHRSALRLLISSDIWASLKVNIKHDRIYN